MSERSDEAKQRGEFLLAHGLQALAIETAEAAAEWLHRRIRSIIRTACTSRPVRRGTTRRRS